MRSIPTIAVLAGVSLAFVACSNEPKKEERSRYGSGSDYVPSYTPPPPPPAEEEPTPDTTGFTTPVPTPTPMVDTTKKDYPYASPVAGKPGFVISPHAPYSGYVDVRGFPPGMEVKDPYTGKVFLVP